MALSPRMRDLAARLLPNVERALKEFPEHLLLWSFWLVINDVAGTGSVVNLIASIEPRPGVTDFPPARARSKIFNSTDISVIERFAKKRFDDAMEVPVDSWGGSQRERLINTTWSSTVMPPIAAYLIQNKDFEAEKTLKKAIKWSEGDCADQVDQAVGFAKRYNKTSLANDWSNISLENIKNDATLNDEADKPVLNLSWIILNEDDSNDIFAAFNKEINSPPLDALQAPVKTEKMRNVPQFANMKTGWGLHDGKNRIVDYTEERPSFDLISDMAKRNGMVSRIEQLESHRKVYLRDGYVEHELLSEYFKLAEKRMARLNQSQPEKRILTEEEDNAIWASAAKLLEELLSNRKYVLVDERIPVPETAIQSPMMKRLAERLILNLEDMIKRDPTFAFDYLLWDNLNTLTGNKHSLSNTILTLPPLPGERLLIYSLKFAEISNKEALKREDWNFIISNSTVLWDLYVRVWADGLRERKDNEIGAYWVH